MIAEALGIDTPERLSQLDWHGHPVLSVYLDLDPARFPTPAARGTQLSALLSKVAREAPEKDVGLIRALLDSEPAIARGARGLAIFSSADADVLQAVRLPSPVEPMAVVDTVPWLEPLAGMISPGDWGVAVVSRSAARLFRGGPNGLTEFAAIHDDLHRRHSQGGWSQGRFQRGIEEQVAFHARRVADHLLRAHQHRPFEHLAIVASDELQPMIVRSLHSTLSERLASTIDANLEHAPTDEIARAVEPVITRAAHDHERALVACIEQALGTGGAAAAGLDEVLSTLEQDRVEALLVPERSTLKAGLCPTCGRLSTDGGRRCPLDDAVLAEVDAIEHAAEEAARRSAPIVVVRHETDWLTEHGGIAALLRW